MTKIEAAEKPEQPVDNTPAGVFEVQPEPINWVGMTDSEIMNHMMDRNLEIPMDNGRLVRLVALQLLRKYEETQKPLSSYRKMRVVFHRSGKEAEAPYVFMSLNGYAYQAPYEKEVLIPEPVIRGCIDDAVVREYEMADFDPIKGCTNYVEKVIRAVPYTFLGYVEA